MQATELNDPPAIKNWIAEVADIHQKGQDEIGTHCGNLFCESPPLMLAASRPGDKVSLQGLIQSGVDVNLISENGHTPFTLAAMAGNIFGLKQVFNEGADIDHRTTDGKTALMLATQSGSLECVRFLLQVSASVDICTPTGMTALMFAAKHKSSDCLTFLLQVGANPNIQNSDMETALMIAAREGFSDCLRCLLQAGANPNVQNTKMETALIIAVREGFSDCLEYLLQAGADPNIPDSGKETALILAARDDFSDSLERLLQAGANPNIQNSDMETALMIAAKCGSYDCLDVLLQSGAATDLCNKHGQTALMLAMLNHNEECAMVLIDCNANINILGSDGQTTLMVAAKLGSSRCLQKLLELGAQTDDVDKEGKTAMMTAAENSCTACLEDLIGTGGDVNITDHSGCTALMHAVVNRNCSECVKVLIKAGADVNVKNKRSQTALMFAARHSCCGKAVAQLLDAGADVNMTDCSGRTALMYAVDGDEYENCCKPMQICMQDDDNDRYRDLDNVMDLLTSSGAVIDASDNAGITALMIAASKRKHHELQFLLQAGALVNKRDNSGKTALMHVTISSGNFATPVTGGESSQGLQMMESTQTVSRYRSYNFQVQDDKMAAFMASSLIDSGTDVNIQDDKGMSALMYALTVDKAYFRQVIHCLLLRGAALELCDVEGRTALVHALHHSVSDLGYYNLNKVLHILEKGAYPLLNVRHRIHLDRFFENLDLDEQYSLKAFRTESGVRFSVCNGIMTYSTTGKESPAFSSYVDRGAWPLLLSDDTINLGVARYLVTNCYLTCTDMERLQGGWTRPCMDDEVRNFLQEAARHPWPLVKLAFIAVSTALGPSPGREERVRHTGLPVPIQECLLFQRPVALLHHDWDKIPMVFNPNDYAKLPTPYPLLYNWPFGRKIVECECSTCKVKEDKFKLKRVQIP